MNDSPSFTRWRKEKDSFFSPVRRKSEKPANFIDYDHTPTSSKASSMVDLLCSAIESHDADSVAQVLLQDRNGEVLDVNQVVSGYSMSLLHLSVGYSENNPMIVEMLLRYGGDPNNTCIDEGLSPLHLSALYDHDKVLMRLIDFGGDATIPTADGQSCYDIVKRNVEDELLEKCFAYFFSKSSQFRKSMAVGIGFPTPARAKKHAGHETGGSDGFYSCESQIGSEGSSQHENDLLLSTARRLFPNYTSLMTEDESSDNSNSDDDADNVRKKLTTITEESGIGSSPIRPAFQPSPSPSPFHLPVRGSGIASMTAPHYLLTEDSASIISDSDTDASASCVNSTPPVTPQPSKEDLAKLQEMMKSFAQKVPVTPSTFQVISKCAESESRLQGIMAPKRGQCNFSTELQSGIDKLMLIHDWGNLKIDFLQNATPTANQSKSFYNYLLLDPRVIKRDNFSGDHLNHRVINDGEKFAKFLLSVFYIGKAHGKRPLQHLVDAKKKWIDLGMGKHKNPTKNGEKIDRILDIWRSGLGVIVVSVFHHSSEKEAIVSEACMIDAVGLVELSNIVRGSYTGTAASKWSQKTKNQLGSFLLYKSYCAFVVGDQKQFHPEHF